MFPKLNFCLRQSIFVREKNLWGYSNVIFKVHLFQGKNTFLTHHSSANHNTVVVAAAACFLLQKNAISFLSHFFNFKAYFEEGEKKVDDRFVSF